MDRMYFFAFPDEKQKGINSLFEKVINIKICLYYISYRMIFELMVDYFFSLSFPFNNGTGL